MDVSHSVCYNVVKVFSLNRINSLAERQAFAHCCELLQVCRKIYRKPTHTDIYLQWDSQHPISSKYSVVGTLHHRARTVCSNTNLLQQEEEDLQKVLTTCKYPNWALNRIKMKIRSTPKKKNKSQNKNTMLENYQQPYLVVSYY